ncbi:MULTISPECIES: activator-dependent family glycosyltransferase [Streptomyces]|uniref:activator-dependent family glycosyltransferase n=1 Tax=Streptomyces TaxID=1883 RepID=UPI001E3D097D|nr:MULTISPECIES: activator-dependent family glycosyltransferase [Streptomyces]UFQ18665.1 activator-dependent family glycosyltransferase [Streptomyces huasconensis]WCL88280.1 activator-dependent family glycosyltransferase [Streptomyces sp. JCM 35825]
MRVLFVTWPWRTHYQPVVPLGWALQTAGHEVRVASGPELSDVITRSGLTAVPVGSDVPVLQKLAEMFTEEHQEIVDTLEKLGPRDDLLFEFAKNDEELLTWDRLRWLTRYLTEILKGMNESMIEDLVEYCRWWQPDLVVWDWLTPAGSIAATAVGAPHARIKIEIDVDARFRREFVRVRDEQAPEDREDAMADWLGSWAEKYGASFSEEMVTGQFTVEQMLGSLRLESDVPCVPMRLIPYNGPAVVPEWTRADPAKPRVLATFGVSQEQGEEYQAFSVEQLQEMLDSLADLDIELVVTLPEQLQKELKRVPANTRVVEFVPLHVIIPSCSAVIHHGGVPAFLDAIAHEVPQLMVGRVVPDIEERAARTAEAGAGLWLPPAEVSGARIREELVRLLDEPAFREAAGRLREEYLAQPTPSEVVRELESRVDRGRSR